MLRHKRQKSGVLSAQLAGVGTPSSWADGTDGDSLTFSVSGHTAGSAFWRQEAARGAWGSGPRSAVTAVVIAGGSLRPRRARSPTLVRFWPGRWQLRGCRFPEATWLRWAWRPEARAQLPGVRELGCLSVARGGCREGRASAHSVESRADSSLSRPPPPAPFWFEVGWGWCFRSEFNPRSVQGPGHHRVLSKTSLQTETPATLRKTRPRAAAPEGPRWYF